MINKKQYNNRFIFRFHGNETEFGKGGLNNKNKKQIINKTKNSLKKKMFFFLIKNKLKSLKKILLNTNIQKQKKYKIKIK